MSAKLTVISYCHMAHRHWIPFWAEQIQKQEFQDFNIIFVAHNWTASYLQTSHLYLKDIFGDRLRFFDHIGPPIIGDVIDFAISKVATDYVAHFDLDDVMHPLRFKLQSQFIDAHPEIDFINARCIGFYGESSLNMDLYARDVSSPLLSYLDDPNLQSNEQIKECFNRGYNCLSHSAMIYKRDIIPKLGGFSKSDVKLDGKSPDFETWRKAIFAGFFFSSTTRTPNVLEA